MKMVEGASGCSLGLFIRALSFTIVVPGAGGVFVPWLILARHDASQAPRDWYAVPAIVLGIALYLWCVWVFAVVGGGTPGPWDAPRRFVAAGPYRWVRNPIYISALLIVSGEALLFLSVDLLLYAGVLGVAFHLIVIAYEEPRLRARFGEGPRPTSAQFLAGFRVGRSRARGASTSTKVSAQW